MKKLRNVNVGFIKNLNLEYERYVDSLPSERVLKVCTDVLSDYSNLVREIKSRLDI